MCARQDLNYWVNEITRQMMDLIRNIEQEKHIRATTRDLFLPKLMSGEIRLTGAEGAA